MTVWTKEEDALLVKAIQEFGFNNWVKVKRSLGGVRKVQAIRERVHELGLEEKTSNEENQVDQSEFVQPAIESTETEPKAQVNGEELVAEVARAAEPVESKVEQTSEPVKRRSSRAPSTNATEKEKSLAKKQVKPSVARIISDLHTVSTREILARNKKIEDLETIPERPKVKGVVDQINQEVPLKKSTAPKEPVVFKATVAKTSKPVVSSTSSTTLKAPMTPSRSAALRTKRVTRTKKSRSWVSYTPSSPEPSSSPSDVDATPTPVSAPVSLAAAVVDDETPLTPSRRLRTATRRGSSVSQTDSWNTLGVRTMQKSVKPSSLVQSALASSEFVEKITKETITSTESENTDPEKIVPSEETADSLTEAMETPVPQTPRTVSIIAPDPMSALPKHMESHIIVDGSAPTPSPARPIAGKRKRFEDISQSSSNKTPSSKQNRTIATPLSQRVIKTKRVRYDEEFMKEELENILGSENKSHSIRVQSRNHVDVRELEEEDPSNWPADHETWFINIVRRFAGGLVRH